MIRRERSARAAAADNRDRLFVIVLGDLSRTFLIASAALLGSGLLALGFVLAGEPSDRGEGVSWAIFAGLGALVLVGISLSLRRIRSRVIARRR